MRPIAVDGHYGHWTQWTVSNGTGTLVRSRERSCNNPPPKNGGAACKGEAKESLPSKLSGGLLRMHGKEDKSIAITNIDLYHLTSKTHIEMSGA